MSSNGSAEQRGTSQVIDLTGAELQELHIGEHGHEQYWCLSNKVPVQFPHDGQILSGEIYAVCPAGHDCVVITTQPVVLRETFPVEVLQGFNPELQLPMRVVASGMIRESIAYAGIGAVSGAVYATIVKCVELYSTYQLSSAEEKSEALDRIGEQFMMSYAIPMAIAAAIAVVVLDTASLFSSWRSKRKSRGECVQLQSNLMD